jgi:hypothetical protein
VHGGSRLNGHMFGRLLFTDLNTNVKTCRVQNRTAAQYARNTAAAPLAPPACVRAAAGSLSECVVSAWRVGEVGFADRPRNIYRELLGTQAAHRSAAELATAADEPS